MVKEIAEKVLGKETRLVKADQIKFLALLIPAENQPLQMELKFRARENRETGVDAQLVNETTCSSFKGCSSQVQSAVCLSREVYFSVSFFILSLIWLSSFFVAISFVNAS